MVTRPLVVMMLSLALGVHRADAEPEQLAQARAALAEVRYDDARTLLVEALRSGTSSPAELAEIYKLSASAATVLGQPDAAEQYYRRWLALVPTATLDDSVAPKLRQPFVSAQAYMAAHGRLSVKAQRRDDVVEIVIETDPLGMVASVALGDAAPTAIGADRVVRVPAADDAVDVHVLDEFGNHLVEIAAADITRVDPSAPGVPAGSDTTPTAVPFYRQPLPWAIATAVFAGGGIAFGLAAGSAHDDVESISANPGAHFASELDDARSRRDRNALLANISWVAAGACLVTGAILYVTRPESSGPGIAIAPTASGAELVISGAF